MRIHQFDLQKRACMSHWFPKLEAAGLPVPKTKLCEIEVPVIGENEREGEYYARVETLVANAVTPLLEAVEPDPAKPVFLRTGHTSAKHDWIESCYVPSPRNRDELLRHIGSIVAYSETVDFLGLPLQVWAVREYLPGRPMFYAFNRMPIRREFRYFAQAGKIICSHPYWPKDSIQFFSTQRGKVPVVPEGWESELEQGSSLKLGEGDLVRSLAELASGALDHDMAWSIDVLETYKGWYVTDCAPMALSYHFPGCPHGGEKA